MASINIQKCCKCKLVTNEHGNKLLCSEYKHKLSDETSKCMKLFRRKPVKIMPCGDCIISETIQYCFEGYHSIIT